MGQTETGIASGAASGATIGASFGPWGAAIGGVVGGIAGGFMGSQASDASKKAAKERARIIAEAEAKWQGVFGTTEQNLANYYNNLDPDDVKAKNINLVQMNYQQAQEEINKELAHRGMTDSGLDSELMAMGQYKAAMDKTAVTMDVEQDIADAQQSFLTLGYQQKVSPETRLTSIATDYNREQSAIQTDRKNTQSDLTAIGTLAEGALNAYGTYNKSKELESKDGELV